MSDWISVKERLPEFGQYVITLEDCILEHIDKYEIYAIPEEISGARYWHDKKFYLDHPTKDNPITLDSVTHWMPLPEPPTK